MRTDAAHNKARAGRRALAAAVVAAAVCGTALTAAPAYASGTLGPIGIGRTVTDAADHGSFTVPVWTDDTTDQITGVTAKVLDGGQVVAERTLTGAGEQWTAAGDPLKLTEDGGTMPHLGRYDVEVTATDSLGATVTRTDAGALDFTLTPEFTSESTVTGPLALDPATVDADHTTETVSGVLVGARPGSGVLVPLAGRSVDLLMGDWAYAPLATQSAVTDAQGHFSGAFQVSSQTGFAARFAESSAEADGRLTSWVQRPSYQSADVAVTAAGDLTRVLPGQKLTITGVVHSTASAQSPGLAGVPVKATFEYGGGAVVTGVTDADGHFSLALPGDQESDGTWRVDVDQPFRSGRAQGVVAVPDESVLTGVTSSLSSNGRVTVTGKLLRTYHRDRNTQGQNVGLWYSPDGRTGWRGLTGTNLSSFDGSFTLTAGGYLDGYYQLRHATSDQLLASGGPVVHLTRTNTHVFQMYAGTAQAKKNSTLTLTGNLKQDVAGVWKPFGGQYVELYFQPRGSTTWKYTAYGRTDSTGHARLTAKAVQDGRWLIMYFGDGSHFDSDAVPVYVHVV